MRRVSRVKGILAGLVVTGIAVTACSSSKSSSTSSPSAATSASSSSSASSSAPAASGSAPTSSAASSASASSAPAAGAYIQANTDPGTGTPVVGGTLHMLGTGDVDYMDPDISYYSVGYMALRLWSRQLFTYPATVGHVTDAVPDLATNIPTTANGEISADGLTYKITIKTGAMWNTTPARQVTAADFVRGVKRDCNPTQPFGGLPDYETLIAGMQTFCDGFGKVSATDAAAQAAYINATPLTGVVVDPSNPQTVDITLVHPATYFLDMLTLTSFSPAPVEQLQYLPASATAAQHTISDGPYEVTKYNPAHEIDFARNPAWQASSDTVRKAYVDNVVITETNDQTAVQQQLQANTSAADMEFDSFPPVASIAGLIASKDPNFNLGPSYGTNPYIVFDTVSPNNSGALGKVAVRQAISEAINRANLIQDDNGPSVSPPLTHVLPPGIDGSTNIDLYPNDTTKAKADLAAAGYPNGLTLKFLYRPSSSLSVKIFTTLQQDLSAAGIKISGVGVPSADFYTKYLEVPSVAKAGTWDLSLAGWGPDWYGNAATSFFAPLFDGAPSYPPTGSNFGFYNDPAANTLIDQATKAQTLDASNALWAQADKQVMEDAAFFPITADLQPDYHATHTHNDIYIPALQQFDPANVWLSKS
jgi:peptide/nickel transport system substrate-binding protein